MFNVSTVVKLIVFFLQLNGETFEGQGGTKKAAKHDAALKALRSFVQYPDAYEASRVLNSCGKDVDFSSDIPVGDPSCFSVYNLSPPAQETTTVCNSICVIIAELFI